MLLAVHPEPIAFYPLNVSYKAAEKENRQLSGILRDVAITSGPYNQPGGAYMFYGTASSYIEFANEGGLDTRYSITLMCWVQPGDKDGLIFSYGVSGHTVCMKIEDSRFFNRIVKRSFQTLTTIITAEVLPAREWVHVAATYDHNSGNNSLYINGHLRASQNIGTGYQIATATQKVRMGVKEGNSSFKGKIAEMKVYNFALNEAQIQTSIRQGGCSYCHVLFLKLLFPYPLCRFPF